MFIGRPMDKNNISLNIVITSVAIAVNRNEELLSGRLIYNYKRDGNVELGASPKGEVLSVSLRKRKDVIDIL